MRHRRSQASVAGRRASFKQPSCQGIIFASLGHGRAAKRSRAMLGNQRKTIVASMLACEVKSTSQGSVTRRSLLGVGIRALAWALALALASALAFTPSAQAETTNVKIMMDWIIQGTHAPFFVAQQKGYFKGAGVTVDAIDAGKGATNVAVSVAGGAYQFGWVDMPSMINFNAKNPSAPLIAVYISFDDSPLALITRKDAGITKPADLDGKKIAGGPGTAVHDTIST